jgi:tetratricopeptide (TPR) repeat protein
MGTIRNLNSLHPKLVDIPPNWSQAWYNRGLVVWQLERHEEAIASFDRTIQIRSDKYQSWYFRGWALLQLRRKDEAIACFDKGIQIKPDYKLGWLSPEW